MKKSLVSMKNNIIEAGKRAYARGYIASNDGNISMRIDAKSILITPTGISKGFMKVSDLVLVDMSGRVIGGKKKPSSELFMHLQIYKERKDVHSVCHLHPPYATGFSVAGIPLDQDVLSEAVIALGKVPLVEYGTPGSEELYCKLLFHLRDSDGFLLANHGALTVGKDIFDAYNRMETLEHVAQIVFIAKQLGNLNILSAEQVQKLTALREKFGIKTNARVHSGKIDFAE
ncbi:MAG: class II aldolase/adducin family protein [Bacteroidota bacterium]